MVSYGRVMFLGPSAVGKTSLKYGLMNEPLPSDPESTIVADVSAVKPVSYEWAKAGNTGEAFWKQVTPKDEIMEIAQLMAAVYQLNKNPSAATVVALQLTEEDRMEVQELKLDKVKDIFQKAMRLARDIPSSNISQDIWLHVWDCGGQPMFLELLPVFLTARTMFLLVFDASKDLHSNWNILQHQQGKRGYG